METNLLADELASSILDIIDAETKPLKKKAHKLGIVYFDVRKKQDDLEAKRLIAATDKSYFEDMGKEF
jgi:hypothetical protein